MSQSFQITAWYHSVLLILVQGWPTTKPQQVPDDKSHIGIVKPRVPSTLSHPKHQMISYTVCEYPQYK